MHRTESSTVNRRRAASFGALLVAAIAGTLLVSGSPASASAPYCRASTWQETSQRTVALPVSGIGGWRCYMARGAHSPAVAALQRSMNNCYSTVIGAQLRVDGDFGTRTRTALLRVQRKLHIRRDGVYGPQTALAMRHVANSGGCDTISHPGG
jgi:peptidoglycan hydrolase-like protein with peptidoglycan-binding domain